MTPVLETLRYVVGDPDPRNVINLGYNTALDLCGLVVSDWQEIVSQDEAIRLSVELFREGPRALGESGIRLFGMQICVHPPEACRTGIWITGGIYA